MGYHGIMESTDGNKTEINELTPEHFSQLPVENQQVVLREYQELKNKDIKSQEIKGGFIEVISENVEPLSKLITNIAEKYIAIKEREVKFSIAMGLIAVGVVTLIIVSAAILTYYGKIDGSTFTFLLGLIVGYVLTFVKESINPPA
jgi:hypothetical protein